MHKIAKNILFGFLVWAILYAIGMALYGVTQADEALFSTLMTVSLVLLGAIFMAVYFKGIKENFCKEGIAIGVVWLVIGIVLDYFFLLPYMKVSLGAYFKEVGLEYLTLPIMTIIVGCLLGMKLEKCCTDEKKL